MNTTKISVVTLLEKFSIADLRHCLRSAKANHIEHFLVIDGLFNPIKTARLWWLAKRHGAVLKINPRPIGKAHALNKVVAIANGKHLLFLEPSSYLVQNWWKSVELPTSRSDFIYSDGFLTDEFGSPLERILNPYWSPVRLQSVMYVSYLMMIRKTTFEELSGFDEDASEGLHHNLAIRASKITERFEHIPLVLACRRRVVRATSITRYTKLVGTKSSVRANDDFATYSSKGLGTVKNPDTAEKTSNPQRSEGVTVVIPTAFKAGPDGTLFLNSLLKSLLPSLDHEKGDEIILVHGGESQADLLTGASSAVGLRIIGVADEHHFNFSRRCNIGFLTAQNKHVLLLNDDIEFSSELNLDHLFHLLHLPNVGLVGALLLFPGEKIQHAGHTFTNRAPHHLKYGEKLSKYSPYELPEIHEVVGVTGAFMFQLKSTWLAVGGFASSLPVNYNDVDYCQKIRVLGFSILQANSIMALHHESATRVNKVEESEKLELQRRWPAALSFDPYFRK
jgi:hypothetical protein